MYTMAARAAKETQEEEEGRKLQDTAFLSPVTRFHPRFTAVHHVTVSVICKTRGEISHRSVDQCRPTNGEVVDDHELRDDTVVGCDDIPGCKPVVIHNSESKFSFHCSVLVELKRRFCMGTLS